MLVGTTSQREKWLLMGIFGVALVVHFVLATHNWTVPFLVGHEFRQTQTALITYYIDRENNFSPIYETPLLGKPWVSVLLEVPIYQWSVVGLSRLAGLRHHVAARTISLACFYLALPAIYLLLGRLALARPQRLFLLALVLFSPVYVFYSRAFLMESMEFLCCAWFLLGFVRTMDERRAVWLALTVVAGVGAALIKGSTFAVWLIPAASYGAWLLWRDLRAGQGWRAPLWTALWGAATIAPAFGALRWWINLTDPIKEAHPSAFIFSAKNLSIDNWGLDNLAAKFSPEVWGILLDRWREALMPPWLLLGGLIVGLAAFPQVRGRVAGLAAIFFLAQLLFPFAYAHQDYYFYACAVFVVLALGLVLLALLGSRAPRMVGWLAVGLLFAAQFTTYWRSYRGSQEAVSEGGMPYTKALKDLTPRGSAVVVAGADWAAIIPYYSQRRALMIRNGLEYDQVYLERAFADLADEDVAALVVQDKARANKPFIEFATSRLDMIPVAPTFSHPAADVYVRRLYAAGVHTRLKNSREYAGIACPPMPENDLATKGPLPISPAAARTAFSMVTPGPFQGKFEFGYDMAVAEGDAVLSAHSDTDLWLRPPADATRIEWDFGIFPEAYQREGHRTNGVEFTVTGETPDGQRRAVYQRLLDPVSNPADGGRQREKILYAPLPDETLRFSARGNGSIAFDWAYWARIGVQ